MTEKEKRVKRYFESYRITLESIEDAKELYSRVFAEATSGAANIDLTGSPVGKYPTDSLGDTVALMRAAEDKIIYKTKKAEKIKRGIVRMVELIDNPITKNVMLWTYIDGKDRGLIAKEIKKTRQTVTNHRKYGIKTIAKRIK